MIHDQIYHKRTLYRHCAFKCINTDGSYECECEDGLTGSGLQVWVF